MRVSGRAIVIDGYNVIKNTEGLAAAERLGGLAAGREAFLSQLASAFSACPDRVYVVFDGDGPAETRTALCGVPHGTVIFSSYGTKADEVITRLCLDDLADTRIILVTNDREVRAAAAQYGATLARSEHLAAHMNQPDKYRRKQHNTRLGATLHDRQITENDGEPIRPSRAGNPRRPPRRRNRRAR